MRLVRTRQIVFVILGAPLIALLPSIVLVCAADRDAELLTGPRFDQALDRRLSVTWGNVPLRSILASLTTSQRVSIVLDRDIDPDQQPSLEIVDTPVRDVLRQLASACGAQASFVGNAIYFGPSQRASVLRTLIRLRTAELFEPSFRISKRRQFELTQPRTVQWFDLDEPAQIIEQVTEKSKLDRPADPRIVHDLWAGATIPEASAAEALSLIVIQFDLTFRWAVGGRNIELIQVPDEVFIERTYRPRRGSADATAQLWRRKFPDMLIAASDNELLVRATAEQHDELQVLLNPPRSKSRSNKRGTGMPLPLSRREFTLMMDQKPALALINQLIASDIEITWDADELSVAGIDLRQRISVNVTRVTAAEFFEQLCEPLGLTFEIDGQSVALKPRPAPLPSAAECRCCRRCAIGRCASQRVAGSIHVTTSASKRSSSQNRGQYKIAMRPRATSAPHATGNRVFILA